PAWRGRVVVEVGGPAGVVRARHFRMNVSRSRRGLLPLGAVAFALNRIPRFLLLGTVTSTNVPQAEPTNELGSAGTSLELTCSFWRLAGGWHAGRFGPCWLMQTATRNGPPLFPHIPSVCHASPSED